MHYATEVSSKYCHACAMHSTWDKASVKYISWEKSHQSKCNINYTGTSGGMEVAGAVAIFSRSEEKYGLRYTRYISDGDSRAFKAVVAAMPYGPSVEMEKLECIGHVKKRMGGRDFGSCGKLYAGLGSVTENCYRVKGGLPTNTSIPSSTTTVLPFEVILKA
jgi:hypothetical protein